MPPAATAVARLEQLRGHQAGQARRLGDGQHVVGVGRIGEVVQDQAAVERAATELPDAAVVRRGGDAVVGQREDAVVGRGAERVEPTVAGRLRLARILPVRAVVVAEHQAEVRGDDDLRRSIRREQHGLSVREGAVGARVSAGGRPQRRQRQRGDGACPAHRRT
jgi:hypothetical protein